MGELSFLLVLKIKQSSKGTIVSQSKYTKELIKKHRMEQGKAFGTPINTLTNLDIDTSGKYVDEKTYLSNDWISTLLYRKLVRHNAKYMVVHKVPFGSQRNTFDCTQVNYTMPYWYSKYWIMVPPPPISQTMI